MKNNQPFDYVTFRYQAVKQLRKGNPDRVDLLGLLAPVISDILETALLPDSLPDTPAEALTANSPDDEKSEYDDFREVSSTSYRPNQHLRKQASQTHRRKSSRGISHPNELSQSIISEETITHARQRIIKFYKEGCTYSSIERIIYNFHQPQFDINFIRQTIDQCSVETQAWQDRPLESVYIVIWISSRTCQVLRNDLISSVTVYSVVGIDVDGRYEILGHYADQQTPNNFFHWLLDDLTTRGVKHIRIICLDNVFDIQTTSHAMYPHTHIHGISTRIVDMCLKTLKGKDSSKVESVLKKVYKASILTESEQLWREAKTDWKDIYPNIITRWEEQWPTISGTFDYPDLVRLLVRDTKAVNLTQKLFDTSASVNGSDTTQDDLMQALRIRSMYVIAKNQRGRTNWGRTMGEVSDVFNGRQKTTDSQDIDNSRDSNTGST